MSGAQVGGSGGVLTPAQYGGMRRVATTGANGFALVNGTSTILAWTAPSDGNIHSFSIFFRCIIAVNETGGHVGFSFGSTGLGVNLNGGGEGNGDHPNESGSAYVALSGETITISQLSALTAGSATVYCEIWAA